MTCPGIDKCPKVDIVLDKDLLDFQAAEAIQTLCRKCEVEK